HTPTWAAPPPPRTRRSRTPFPALRLCSFPSTRSLLSSPSLAQKGRAPCGCKTIASPHRASTSSASRHPTRVLQFVPSLCGNPRSARRSNRLSRPSRRISRVDWKRS
ncbi:hypothetical protein T484DRAFT_2025449, partial [Baffinella frigidus]